MKSEVASNSKSSVYSYIRAFNHVLVISSGVWLLSCFSSINMNFFNELSAIMSVHLLRKRIVYIVLHNNLCLADGSKKSCRADIIC